MAVVAALLSEKRQSDVWLGLHYADYAPRDIGPLGKEFSRLLNRLRKKRVPPLNWLRAFGHLEAVEAVLTAIIKEGDGDERWAADAVADELGASVTTSDLSAGASGESFKALI